MTIGDQPHELIGQIEMLWQFGARPPQGGFAGRLAQRALLHLLSPLLAQQRDFNAAIVKLMYALVSQHNALAAHIVSLRESQNLLQQSIYALGNQDGELNDRLTRLVYTTQLLDNAVAEADGAQAEIAAQLSALSMRLGQPSLGGQRDD